MPNISGSHEHSSDQHWFYYCINYLQQPKSVICTIILQNIYWKCLSFVNDIIVARIMWSSKPRPVWQMMGANKTSSNLWAEGLSIACCATAYVQYVSFCCFQHSQSILGLLDSSERWIWWILFFTLRLEHTENNGNVDEICRSITFGS